MKKLNKIILAIAAFAMLLATAPQESFSQTSIGASYEIRDEDPQNGYGIRIERQLLEKAPVVNLGLRAHFSYFSDENSITYNQNGTSYSYSQDITTYDYGLAAVGGVSVAVIDPYIGLGLGASTLDVTRDDLNSAPFDEEADDSSIYWNGFIGAKVSALPIQPFVEYRLEDVSDYEDELNDVRNSNGRLIFGVSLSF